VIGRAPAWGRDAVATPKCWAASRLPPRRTREHLRRASLENLLFSQWFSIVFANRQGTLLNSVRVVPCTPGHAQDCCGERAAATPESSRPQVVRAGDHRSRPSAPAICCIADFVDFQWFSRFLRKMFPFPGPRPRRRRPDPGDGADPARTYCFRKVFQWFPWDPRPIRGRGGGPLRGDAACCIADFVDFPMVFKVFEEDVSFPGAPPGGRPGGAFRKPMNFQGF